MIGKMHLLILLIIIPISSARVSLFEGNEPLVDFFEYKSFIFHEDSSVDGTVSPVYVNGRVIKPYAYSYKKAEVQNTGSDFKLSKNGSYGLLRLDFALAAGLISDQNWKEITKC